MYCYNGYLYISISFLNLRLRSNDQLKYLIQFTQVYPWNTSFSLAAHLNWCFSGSPDVPACNSQLGRHRQPGMRHLLHTSTHSSGNQTPGLLILNPMPCPLDHMLPSNLLCLMLLLSSSGYDMSTYIRRYAKYINEKAFSYRSMAFDFCKVKRGWVKWFPLFLMFKHLDLRRYLSRLRITLSFPIYVGF